MHIIQCHGFCVAIEYSRTLFAVATMSVQVNLVVSINFIVLLVFHISSSNGQCVGKVLITRTSSNCKGQFMFGCGGGGSNTISGPWTTLCDEIGIPEGCRGAECNKTFDLTKDDCQSPGILNTVPTLYPGMKPTNTIDCTCSIEDLIRAIRIQSALGALVGLLSFMLVVAIIGWVRTYFVMRRREEIRNLHQVRNRPINMANNPAYVHHINEDNASGSQTQSNTYESVTDH